MYVHSMTDDTNFLPYVYMQHVQWYFLPYECTQHCGFFYGGLRLKLLRGFKSLVKTQT